MSIRRIHQKLGTAGFIVSIVALVVALGGGAYAAKGALTAKQKKEVQKIAKAEAKKYVKAGPTGPVGPAGGPGPVGAVGKEGTAGKEGAKGETGATGKTGAAGKEGSPWTAGGTLPKGATETGNWSAVGYYIPGSGAYPFGAISYPIPLAAPPTTVKYLNKAETEASVGSGGCELNPTSAAFIPKAPADTLCVFTRVEENGTFRTIESNVAGAFLRIEPTELTPETAAVGFWGTWAVTAP